MIDATTYTSPPKSGFFARAYREILADRAPLPSMPDVAVRIRAAMQQPNYNAKTIARLINADPVALYGEPSTPTPGCGTNRQQH